MSIDIALDISNVGSIEFATATYLAKNVSIINGIGKEINVPDLEFATDSCLAKSLAVCTPSFEIVKPSINFGTNVTIPSRIKTIEPNGNELYPFARRVVPGDTGQVVDVGYYAEFHTDRKIQFVNQPVLFFDDTYGPETIIWSWDFGDGNTSNLQNPTNIYNTPGIYTISLEVTNIYNRDAKETKFNYITILNSLSDYMQVIFI